MRTGTHLRASVAVIAAACFLTTACSFTGGSKQPLTVMASDPRAAIYVDGRPVGTGTATVQVKRNRAHSIMVRVDDRAGVGHVGKTISTLGVLDLVGGLIFLVPFVGIFAPGFWTLQQDTVMVAVPAASDSYPAAPSR